MNMSVKRGDVVLYALQGRTLNAIVLATRSSEVAHLGSKDEPLVSLAFSDPARETGLAKDPDTGEYVYPFGRVPQIFIEHDVVHASHEFSDEFKAKLKAWRPRRGQIIARLPRAGSANTAK
jgi:hypothetical protein